MPGKWKQTLEGTRKRILMCYLPDLKKTQANKSSPPKPTNPPDVIFYCWDRNVCLPAGIPVTAAARVSRGSKSGKGHKNSNHRAVIMPDSLIKHLPKMPELRHVAFCAARQLSKNFDNSCLLKHKQFVLFMHQLPEKILHQRWISPVGYLRRLREP